MLLKVTRYESSDDLMCYDFEFISGFCFLETYFPLNKIIERKGLKNYFYTVKK